MAFEKTIDSVGEINTASNVGTGIGVFKQKVGVDLQFNNLKSENSLLNISLDGVTNDIEFTVDETNISHLNIQDIGTNTHAQIDTHIADSTIHFTESSIDHGSISGLLDDDHTQYLLADGTRDLTGDWTITSNDIIFNDNQGIIFGTGQDGYIYYDGSDLKIKSDEVGTGRIHLLSNVFTDRWSNQASNTLFGVNAAGSGNLSGGFNTLYGNGAGDELTTGYSNVCIGYLAGRVLTTEYEDVIIGALAGRYTEGIRDVIIGAQAAQNKTTGNSNTIIGHQAAQRTAGLGAISSTVLIGRRAGYVNAPSQCVFLGYHAGYHESNTHRLYIANSSTVNPLIYGEFDNKLIRLNAETDLISSVHPILYLRHKAELFGSSVGFGVSLNYELDDSGGNAELSGVTECVWTDATNGSEDADFVWKLMDGGTAAAERARLTSDGDFKITNDYYSGGNQGLSGTLTLDDGANWRITLTFTGGILTGQTTGASSAATATWV